MTKQDYLLELNKNGFYVFSALGDSMWPIIKNGRHKVMLVLKKDRLKSGDVAMFERADGTCVLHRVIEVTASGYWFCGDSQYKLEKVAEKDVFAVMQGFYDKKGFISADDEGYVKRYTKWYSKPKRRRGYLKLFYMRKNFKDKFKRKKNG